VASLSQGRTAAAQCGLFTYKSVPVIFEPPCIFIAALNQGIFCTCYHRLLFSSMPTNVLLVWKGVFAVC